MRDWLVSADEELRSCELLLDASPPLLVAASFHAQQAAEKALKALLIRFDRAIDKTHDLGALLERADRDAPGIAVALAPIGDLTAFAVGGRYPGGPRAPVEIARHHAELALRAVERVQAVLRPYLDTEPSAT